MSLSSPLVISSSGSAPSLVMMMATLVVTAKPAPSTLGRLAIIMSAFLLPSFLAEFSKPVPGF